MFRPTAMLLLLAAFSVAGAARAQDPMASDDFESDLSQWQTVGRESNVRIIPETPGESANHVLELVPQTDEFVHTLLRGSAGWTHLRVEGRLLFPTSGDGYLGLIYNHRRQENRTDFGCIYVKGNGSYVRISPHRDGNPSWRLYEELKVPLEGERAIEVGRWYPFRLDVIGREARFSIGDLDHPVVRFDMIETERGEIGFEARPGRGDPVWIDDVVVRRLDTFPEIEPLPEPDPVAPAILTRWEVFGPFAAPNPEIERGAGTLAGRLIEADRRGMVITGRLTERYGGDRHLAYLRTTVDGDGTVSRKDLVVSTANRLDVWLDGRHLGTIEPQDYAWTDFLTKPEHVAARIPVELSEGSNILLIRVDGDRFAAGGFLAVVTDAGEPSTEPQ